MFQEVIDMIATRVIHPLLVYIREIEKYLDEVEERFLEFVEESESRRKVYQTYEATRVLISVRLVELGILTEQERCRVLRTYRSLQKGRTCPTQHPDSEKFRRILSDISKQLSITYYQLYGEEPGILNSDRSNIYTSEFFQDYGDAIIWMFLDQKPLETWGIDWEWEI